MTRYPRQYTAKHNEASLWALVQSSFIGSKTWLLVLIALMVRTNSALSLFTGSSSFHTCALGNMGFKCFGKNDRGQLGLGDTNNRGDSANEMGDNLPFGDLGTNKTPMQFATSGYHTCSLTTTDELKCFGYNSNGELGAGSTWNEKGDGPNEMGDNLLPVDLGSFTPIQISTATFYTCALSSANQVKCFGKNHYGQLGAEDTMKRGGSSNTMGDNLLPVDLGTGFEAIQIACGLYHVCALSTSNQTKCFGRNNYGQLGTGDTVTKGDSPGDMGDNLLPVDLGTGFIPMQIASGGYHVCALSRANQVKCFGENDLGQLGYGDTSTRGDGPNEMGDALPEIDLGTGFEPMQIVTGFYHTCALSKAHQVKCFGYNIFGQLGMEDTNNRGDEPNEMGDALPEIDLGTGFEPMQIVAGYYHTCALSKTYQVKCFGGNDYGQLGMGDTNNRGDEVNEMGDNLFPVDLGSITTLTAVPTALTAVPSVAPSGVPTMPTTTHSGANYAQLGVVTMEMVIYLTFFSF